MSNDTPSNAVLPAPEAKRGLPRTGRLDSQRSLQSARISPRHAADIRITPVAPVDTGEDHDCLGQRLELQWRAAVLSSESRPLDRADSCISPRTRTVRRN